MVGDVAEVMLRSQPMARSRNKCPLLVWDLSQYSSCIQSNIFNDSIVAQVIAGRKFCLVSGVAGKSGVTLQSRWSASLAYLQSLRFSPERGA